MSITVRSVADSVMRPLARVALATLPLLLLTGLCLGNPVLAADGAQGPGLRYYYPLPKANPPQSVDADVCVYGATPAGVTAAIQAARMGKRAVLVEFGRHVGGLTASGLSATDGGRSIGGLAAEFYKGLGAKAGFLPGIAEARFRAMLAEAKVEVFCERRLAAVTLDRGAIHQIAMENGDLFRARVYIDATYEGDLMAKAGVSFTVGREANAAYGETIDGIRKPGEHNFVIPIDPYGVAGDQSSGLLPGITNAAADAPGASGAGDKRIQAYNFRMFLAKMPDAIPFPKPAAYDAKRYELLARYLAAGAKVEQVMQAHVGDSNNQGGFSTDDIGMNYEWPEASYETREKIYQEHVAYQQGLMWFLANDARVPDGVRSVVSGFGLDRRCFPDTGGWPHQLYVREARRMVSAYVMTEHDCRGEIAAADPVGLGEYNMDSHNCQRFVSHAREKPMVKNEGDVQEHVPGPYPISYRAIVPKLGECANLLVPVCLSATHIAYGSIRMEPVFMVLGQSAGAAATMAIDAHVAVQGVDYPALRVRLEHDGEMLSAPEKKK